MSDVPAVFIADPFVMHFEDMVYIFVEVLNNKNQRGEIGLFRYRADMPNFEYMGKQ